MPESFRLRTQVDTAAVLEQLQDLVWDPAIDHEKLRRIQGMLEAIAAQLRKDTHAVHKGPPLQRRTAEVLGFIQGYIEEHQRPPSVRDIMVGTKFKSSSSVTPHIKKLIAAGYIETSPNSARSIRIVEQPR
jgi:LexA DNA binding domain-containing protein